MKITRFPAIVLSLGMAAAACGPREKISDDATGAPATDQAPEVAFDLMAHSGLDTTWGVFEGEYEETVNDTITVKARVRVRLEEGRIAAIEVIDTAWVHPAAARLIPQRIIEEQRLPVEAVSGASVASWTLMTATAVALEIDLMELEDQPTEKDSLPGN